MIKAFSGRRGIQTLHDYLTLIIPLITALSLLCSGLFYYRKTSLILTQNYKQSVVSRLEQVTVRVEEQTSLIDSIPALLLSNSFIRETLDPLIVADDLPADRDRVTAMEKQMNYVLMSSYFWNSDFIDAVYIFDRSGAVYHVTAGDASHNSLGPDAGELPAVPEECPSLMITTLPSDQGSVYFGRNLYSIHTGKKIASIIIDVNREEWMRQLSTGMEENWMIRLYNDNMNVLSDRDSGDLAASLSGMLTARASSPAFRELKLDGTSYFTAAGRVSSCRLNTLVAAPKQNLFADLNNTLKSYLWFLAAVLLCTVIFSLLIAETVSRPIDRMISYVKGITSGTASAMPACGVYQEFNEFSKAFNQMLEKLDISYNDNFQKQLLLKDAEIRSLQSQMDPHFLLNVLNTLAWKAQMSGNEEIYQMVISLGELLKYNIHSRENAFTTVKEEMDYVQFYIYLQKMRFEDKISVDIQIDPSLYSCRIPRLCIQPLVENAIVHGLEPKKGKGRLAVNMIRQDNRLEIIVADNGIGFDPIPEISSIRPSSEDGHTHIGLRNLDKRLSMLYGEQARLKLASVPGQYTSVTFRIPIKPEV